MSKQLTNDSSASNHARLLSSQARETIDKVAGQLSEQSAAGALARGKMFELVGYFPEAVDSYVEALSCDRNNTEASARLALAQLKAEQREKALATATALAARQPAFKFKALVTNEQVSSMTVLGDALVGNGRLEEAKEAYQAARKIDGKDSYAAGRLAELHLANKDFKKALDLRKDFKDNPRFEELNSLMALSDTSDLLLPRFSRESLSLRISAIAVGRPLLVDGMTRFASVVEGDEEWCADSSEQSDAP